MRYIDDVLGIWTHGEDKLNKFFEDLNNFHPTIKFTMESTAKTGSLAFLDTIIRIQPNGSFSTEPYLSLHQRHVI